MQEADGKHRIPTGVLLVNWGSGGVWQTVQACPIAMILVAKENERPAIERSLKGCSL